MRVMRAALVLVVTALMVALGLAFPAAAQERQKIEVMPQIGHAASVRSVAFAPSGKHILTGSDDKTAKLWEVSSGRLVRSFEGHSDGVTSVVFSHDGALVLSGSHDKTIKLWDINTGQLIRTFEGHSKAVRSVAFSKDGSRVLSGGDDANVKLWERATGKLIRTFEDTLPVRAVAFSPDGLHFVAGYDGQAVRRTAKKGERPQVRALKLWEVGSGNVARAFDDEWGVDSVAFSPDGQQVLSGGNKLKLWDVQTGSLVRTFGENRGGFLPKAVALSPNGKSALSGGAFNALELWDVETGKLLHKFEKREDAIEAVAFAPDGMFVLSGGGWGYRATSPVLLWQISTGKLVRRFEGQADKVRAIALSPDGAQLLSGNGGKVPGKGGMTVWEPATGRLIRRLEGHTDETLAVAFSPDGKNAVASSRWGGDREKNGIKQWELNTGRMIWEIEDDAGVNTISASAYSPNGKRILTGNDSGKHKLRNAVNGQLLRTFGKDEMVLSVAFSPDGKYILSGLTDENLFAEYRTGETIKLWDANSGVPVRSLKGQSTVMSVAFSTDGNHFLTGGFDGTAKLWETRSGRVVRTFADGDIGSVQSVAFSRDGRFVLSGNYDRTIRLWDATSGKLIRRFAGHSGGVNSAVFSPDGGRIFSGSDDGTIRIWNAATSEWLVTLLAGDDDAWLAITPEGFFAASPKGAEMLSVVSGLEVFSIDQFYQVLYRPDLVQEKLAGDPTGKVKEAAAKLDLAKLIESGRVPAIKFISHQAEQTSPTDLVTIEASLADQGGGLGRIEWRINGITVGVVDKPTATLKQAVALDPGENVVELVAYNGANLVSSLPARTKIIWNGAEPTARPRLHVLVAGINAYRDGALKLNYAVPDAKAIAAAFQEAGREHYEEVIVTFALDGDATVKGLDRIFAEVAAKVRPRDVFVFFAAGHGKTVDGRYFLLPQDIKYQTEQSLIEQGIGQDKLQAWFAKIAAKKSVLIFDTCEAGSLTQRVATRGLEQKAALGRLIQATGRATLTASTATQEAYEGYGGHGVFTFAILDALARGDTSGNGLIELAELVQHVDGLVPAITEKRWGARQFPQMDAYGSNFSLVRQVGSLAPAKGDDVVIPLKPTHVSAELLAIFEQAGGKGVVVQRLEPFTAVTLVKSEQGWVLIAKDGKLLGYVAEAKLRRLN